MKAGFYTKGLWCSNIFAETPGEKTGRWETHPEEYSEYPIEELWK